MSVAGNADDSKSEPLVGDSDAAIAFLKRWWPGPKDMVHLNAIPVDRVTHQKRKLIAKAFTYPVDWGLVRTWIENRNRQDNANVYFTVNSLTRPKNDKAARKDIETAVALHVDIDVPSGEDQEASAAAIVERLQQYDPPPSVVIISGGGAQAFWLLDEPYGISGGEPTAREFERYTRYIEDAFSDLRGVKADACHDVCRMMRLVGTINIPDVIKVEKGRKPALARLVHADWDLRYPISAFKKAESKHAPKALEPRATSANDNEIVEPVKMISDPRLADVRGDVKQIIATGGDDPNRRSELAHRVAIHLVRAKVPDAVIRSVFYNFPIGNSARESSRGLVNGVTRQIEQAHLFAAEDLSKPPICSKVDWALTRGKFLLRVAPDLLYWNGSFYDYAEEDHCYHDLERKAVESMAGKFLHGAMCLVLKKGKKDKDGNVEEKLVEDAFKPQTSHVEELVKELCRHGYQSRDAMAPPCWLAGADGPPAVECISLQNGILHVPTRKVYSATPDFFSLNSLDFNYDPAAQCPLWLKTIGEWWPRGEDGAPMPEEMLLQEIFGYLLTPWTSLQKLFLLIGPGRCGKGTIMRVLRMLLGERNAVGADVDGLVDTFGKAKLIGKLVALLGEVDLDANTRTKFTNLLKTISGEDVVSANRKNQDEWIGVLLCRFVLAVNKMPGFSDDSDAFVNRLVVLTFVRSFADNPDPELTSKLAAELPGILNWALEGYDRLRKTGKFTVTEAGAAAAKDLGRAASPAKAFVQDCCSIDAESTVTEKALYGAYVGWSHTQGKRPDGLGEVIDAILAGNINVERHRPSILCKDCGTTAACGHAGRCATTGKGIRVRSVKGLRILGSAPCDPKGEQGDIPF